MHCFHVYLSGKKCPAAFVELRLTSTFPCVCRCRVVGFFYSPSLSSLLFSGFLNFLSKLLSNHVRCSLSIFPIYQPLFFFAKCCIANRCCNTLEFAWQNVTHHKFGLSNSHHPRLRTTHYDYSLWIESLDVAVNILLQYS